jgi:hypothetical protein
MAIGATINKEEFKMNVTKKLFLASLLALSIAAPVQAQNPQQGDTTCSSRGRRNK